MTPDTPGRSVPAQATARTGALAVVALCALILLSGCFASGSTAGSPKPTPVASMAQPIPTGDGMLTIGALVPLSGADSATGAAQLAGAELAARDIGEAGGVRGMPVVVLHGDAGDAGSGSAAESVATFAGRGVDAIVGPNAVSLQAPAGESALAAGIPMVAAVSEPVPVDDAFARRLATSDPSVVDTRLGAESYDATVVIALAAALAGDDGRASIAEFLPAVTSGDIDCSSYGECLEVLKSRADIRYTGVTGQLSTDAAAPAPGTLALLGLTR